MNSCRLLVFSLRGDDGVIGDSKTHDSVTTQMNLELSINFQSSVGASYLTQTANPVAPGIVLPANILLYGLKLICIGLCNNEFTVDVSGTVSTDYSGT